MFLKTVIHAPDTGSCYNCGKECTPEDLIELCGSDEAMLELSEKLVEKKKLRKKDKKSKKQKKRDKKEEDSDSNKSVKKKAKGEEDIGKSPASCFSGLMIFCSFMYFFVSFKGISAGGGKDFAGVVIVQSRVIEKQAG